MTSGSKDPTFIHDRQEMAPRILYILTCLVVASAFCLSLQRAYSAGVHKEHNLPDHGSSGSDSGFQHDDSELDLDNVPPLLTSGGLVPGDSDDSLGEDGGSGEADALGGMFDFEPFAEDGQEGEEEETPYDELDSFYDDEEEIEFAEDDGDVVTLTQGNFSETVSAHENMLVEFYAPWCGHCKELAPHYREAASLLKDDGVVLAKVDAEAETGLAESHEVQGFPTILFFSKGISRPYTGGRQSADIVEWVRKKLGPAVVTLKEAAAAEEAMESEPAIAVAYFESLEGPEFEQFQQAAKMEDGLFMAQTSRADIAAALGFPAAARRPALAVLKHEEERRVEYDGPFEAAELRQFMAANRNPLVLYYNEANAERIFGGAISKQVLLFATSEQSGALAAPFREAAKPFKSQVTFVYVNRSDDVSASLIEFFGATSDGPLVMAFETQGEGLKHLLAGEITEGSVKSFAEGFLAGSLQPFYKSDPAPEQDDSGVTVVVGETFEGIVFDNSKDVLLEVYAPWCGHCQKLEPVYRRLGLRFSTVPSLVVAKMDGTTNEHPNVTVEGFPTILFYPANNKTDPVKVEVAHKLKALTEFLKEHASIPFRLPKRGELLETSSNGHPVDDMLRPTGGALSKDEL